MNTICYAFTAIFSVALAYIASIIKQEYGDKAEDDNIIESDVSKKKNDICIEENIADPNTDCVKNNQSENKDKNGDRSFSILFAILMLAIYSIAAIVIFVLQTKSDIHILTATQYVVLWDSICIIAIIDSKVKKIPTFLVWLAVGTRICFIISEMAATKATIYETVIFSFLGAVVGGGIIAICKIFAKNGVGMGDIRLFALVGFYLGLAGLMNVMFYTMLIAAVFGIILIICKKAAGKTTIAMAPFVFIGVNLYILLLF